MTRGIDIYEVAERYSPFEGSALCKFTNCEEITAELEEELIIEINFISDKLKSELSKCREMGRRTYLENEINSLNYLLYEIQNPDITPIMER